MQDIKFIIILYISCDFLFLIFHKSSLKMKNYTSHK